MKNKIFKLGATALSLALSISCMAGLAACDNGEKPGPDNDPPTPPVEHHHTYEDGWTNDATHHWHKATCEHTDEVNGKEEHRFTDGVCTVCTYADPNYKAPIMYTSHYFETEDPHLDANGGTFADYGLGTDMYAAARFQLDDFDADAPNQYNFAVDAAKAGPAKVSVRIKSRKTEMNLAESGFQMMFNDEPVTLTAVVPAAEGASYDFYESKEGFVWVELAEVELTEGANYIDFVASNNKGWFAIDKIDVSAEGDVAWHDEDGKHYCEHWCASCRGCLDLDCQDTECKTKGASSGSIRKKNDKGKCKGVSGTAYEFEAEDAKAVLSSGVQTVAAEDENAGYATLAKGQSVTFNVTMENQQQRICYRILIGKPAADTNIFDMISFKIDGKDVKDWNPNSSITVGALASGETVAFAEINFGCIFLAMGPHTVEVTSVSDTAVYLDKLIAIFRDTVSWTEAA